MREADDGSRLFVDVMLSGGCNVAVAQHSGTGENSVPVADAAAEFFAQLVQRFLAANPVLTQPARYPFKDILTSVTGVGRIRLRHEVRVD